MAGEKAKKALALYSETHREPFNEQLFIRSEYDIIENLKLIIQSFASPSNVNSNDSPLFIGINYFKVIDDYREVKSILYELESKENRRNNRVDYNIHDYINLNDSSVILLEVNYHLEVNGDAIDGSVYIDVPRVINKYYFKICGTIYSALYQISDASTYNNANGNKKKTRCVVFRQETPKYEIYEKHVTLARVVYNEENGCNTVVPFPAINYTGTLFGTSTHIIKYFLAKFGYYGAMKYLHLDEIILSLEPYKVKDPDMYTFTNENNVYMSIPARLFDNNHVAQAFIFTVLYNIPKQDPVELIFGDTYWVMLISGDKNKSVEKGRITLDSVDRLYSHIMKKSLRLPEEDKESLYAIIRWQMYEFDALWAKDNYDLSYKKIRMPEYIAGFYASKLIKNIAAAGNAVSSLTVEKFYNKYIKIEHTFVCDALKSSNLVSYKNGVNDDDATAALKHTFKGESGLGDNKVSAIPMKYRLTNPSHIGKLDADSSSAGDPGMTGIISPYATIYPGGYMSDYQEPCSWRVIQDTIMDEYRATCSKSTVFIQLSNLTEKQKESLGVVCEKMKNLIPYVIMNDPIEEGS